MKLFVPGRICLFGEHSDWAGGHRRMNADIEKGVTIIAGTNQGIYAEVTPHPTMFIFETTLPDGTARKLELPMQSAALLEEAEGGGFFSHIAGVAYQILTHYRVHGLVIKNYKTDLPVRKGLSSSAAVCVLVARAFNRTYDLKMTVRGEMELAYLGEITTPSRCGRMDQGCAYGSRPILMTFDGERIDVRELSVPRDLYFVIADLGASKDTKEILRSLNRAFPFASDDMQRGVHEYLGPINSRITTCAARALEQGDAKRLGELMQEAQREFDSHLQAACPQELTAPVLHRTLDNESVKALSLGGKGVGSQGDGSVQFIVEDEQTQKNLMAVIEQELGMSCLSLVLRSGRRVRKAVIPAAGFGTRLFPATKAIKKEMFPVIDNKGRAKPAILAIVEEALSAGIEEVCIVVQAGDVEMFQEAFRKPLPVEHFNKLSREDQEYSAYLLDIGHKITFVPQETQDGFGHAVYCAREWVNGEPFLLLLGDHLYSSDTGKSCARQLVECFDTYGHSVVGVKMTPGNRIHSFGCVTGNWQEDKTSLFVTEFAEKPTLDYAREHLEVADVEDDHYLTVFGQYVLKPEIFDHLEEHIRHNVREGGEFQLTSCLDRLRQEDGFVGYRVSGKRFDLGRPDAYRQTLIDFRNA